MTGTDLWIAMPLLLLSCGALLTLLVGAISSNRVHSYCIATVVASGAALWQLLTPPATVAPLLGLSGGLAARTFTFFFCFMAAAAIVLAQRYNFWREADGEEYPATVLFTAFGMTTVAAANNLLILFLGLEAMTFGFYILVAFDLKRDVSGEVGLKYLLTGSLSAAFMTFGMALLYCASGTLAIPDVVKITLASTQASPHLALAGWGLILAGMAFKLSLAPAHPWTADVYEGAPAPVVAFLASGSKGAAILFLLLLLPRASDAGSLRIPFWWLALFSMIIGNLGALLQTRVRRMLAYSSIAHMGYVALALLSGTAGGYLAAAYYALSYGIISMTAFGAISVLERNGCGPAVEDYRGLGASRPFVAGVLTLALFALAGIPPTAGFTGKFMIFASALNAGEIPLAIIGMFTAAASVYYYLRIVVSLYFAPSQRHQEIAASRPELVVLSLLSGVIILMGGWPDPLIRLLTSLFP